MPWPGRSGTVEHTTADTIQDERGNSAYRVTIRTEPAHLLKDGRQSV